MVASIRRTVGCSISTFPLGNLRFVKLETAPEERKWNGLTSATEDRKWNGLTSVTEERKWNGLTYCKDGCAYKA